MSSQIKDEFTLVTDLSYHMAQRYARQDYSIMINVDHSACLAMAGTFEPCYILTITAVPSQFSPSQNKRNAALIQSFMADILSVPPDRGVVRFNAILDENIATNGTTVLGDIERMEKHSSDEKTAMGARGYPAAASNPSRKSQTYTKRHSLIAPNEQPRTNGTTIADKRKSINSAIFDNSPAVHLDSRPSTSHGAYAAENGLRMNGISKEDLLLGKDSKLSNGRPKSYGGPPVRREASEKSFGQKSSNITTAPSIPPSSTTPRQPNIPISPKPVLTSNYSATKAASAAVSGSAPRSNPSSRPGSIAPSTKPASSFNNASSTDAAAKKVADARLAADKARLDSKASREANTAKRRSTITATPKMPPPPPEPTEKMDAAKALKVSKRKSFLSAFRR